MLFSVIVPVYNCEKYHLLRGFNSLNKLSEDDYEIIVIDDGSDFDVKSFLETNNLIRDNYRFIKQENMGVSCARNNGISIAKGDWIIFCDADDILEDNINKHSNELNESIDFLYSDYFKESKNNRKIIKLEDSLNKDEYIKKLLCHPNLYGTIWGKLFRRDFLIKNNITFNEDISHGEDSIFLLKVLFKVNRISKTTIDYCYYVNNNSSSKNSENALHGYLKSMRVCREILDSNNYSRLYLGNYCLTNILVFAVNHLFSDRENYENDVKTLNYLLEQNIIKQSIVKYETKEMSIYQKLCISIIEKKMYNLLKMIVILRKSVR